MYKVVASKVFQKDAKPLLKKYALLKSELLTLAGLLAENPLLGTPLGKNCYKVRLSIKSKVKGKSGGARVITCIIHADQKVVLLTIYDKQVKPDLRPNELEVLLKDLDY